LPTATSRAARKGRNPRHAAHVNDSQEVDFYYQLPGQRWQTTQESAEISGMQHKVLGGFLDVRAAVYACGSRAATFRAFRHWAQVQAPA
jgi:beta-xylosidase